MDKQQYLFQRKKTSFTKRVFEKGVNASSYILFSLKENGKLFTREVAFASILPNILQGIVNSKTIQRAFTRAEISITLSRLEKQGLVRKEPKKKVYVLTDKGEKLVIYVKERYEILDKSWDGKIRMVIFDIPEEKKFHREWLRKELLLLQYRQLQKSVYAGKFPLPKSFYREIIKFGLDKLVFVFTADKIDKKSQILEFLD